MALVLDTSTKPAEIRDGNGEPAVAVVDLHKAFGQHQVLNGISLRVEPGATLAVLGRSGTGKSVLLRLIIGLDRPDSGSITIQGQQIAELTSDQLNDLRKKMGFLFQHAALYDSLTAAGNVGFPLEHHCREISKSERDERVHQLLAEVGVEESAQKMPSELSGGMQKRVGLARALALSPEILLLDEPTAGLDPISSREIDDLILKLQSEHHVASIVVTHDLLSARTISNRLAILDKGNVVIEGTFEDLQGSELPFVREFLQHS